LIEILLRREPGGGAAVRSFAKAGEAADTVVDTVKLIDKVDDAVDLATHGDDLGDAISHADEIADTYTRPSWFRNRVRDTVWDAAMDADGVVRDPGTGEIMSKTESRDMCHKPGYEFRKHQASANERGISRKEFFNEYDDPSHYRPELPSNNRSHRYENKTGEYFGY
jgi:predicted ribonuclease toxin of YeeF-YezG toxin-antitoxin module